MKHEVELMEFRDYFVVEGKSHLAGKHVVVEKSRKGLEIFLTLYYLALEL